MSFSRLSFRSALLAVSGVALLLSFDGYNSDIASCGSPGAERTARLLDDIPGTVFTLGDNAYHAQSKPVIVSGKVASE